MPATWLFYPSILNSLHIFGKKMKHPLWVRWGICLHLATPAEGFPPPFGSMPKDNGRNCHRILKKCGEIFKNRGTFGENRGTLGQLCDGTPTFRNKARPPHRRGLQLRGKAHTQWPCPRQQHRIPVRKQGGMPITPGKAVPQMPLP